MKKFLLLYFMDDAALERARDIPPDKMQESMKAWFACGDKLVDLGAPLGNKARVANGYAPATQHTTGHTLMQADTIDEIKALVDAHPYMQNAGHCIEIHELLPPPTA